jgi:hypothetical protein
LLENLAAPQVSAFRSARVAPTDLEGRSFLQKKNQDKEFILYCDSRYSRLKLTIRVRCLTNAP